MSVLKENFNLKKNIIINLLKRFKGENMIKEYIKKYNRSSIITSILMIIVAILLIVKPIKAMEWIIIFLSAIIIIDGIFDFINYFKSDKETKLYSFGLIEGLLEVLAGILVILNKDVLIAFLPLILGSWIILKNIIKIQLAINLKQFCSDWYLLLIFAILSLLFGILIILNPFSVITITLLSGIFLLITEIFNLIENIYFMIKLK